MINYIRAELYRGFNRMFFWVYSLMISGCGVLMIVLFKRENVYTPFTEVISKLGILYIAVFLLAAIFSMVTCEEYEYGTQKNVLSFGVSRNTMVMSKFIASIIFSIVFECIIFASIFIAMAVIFGTGGRFISDINRSFLMMLEAFPLWIGVEALGTFLAFLISNNTIFAFVYAGIFMFLQQIVNLLSYTVSDKFIYVHKALISTQLVNIGKSHGDITLAVASGAIYTIVFIALTMIYMQKKDIK